MAIEQTQVLPAPILSKALEAFVDKFPPMMGQAIDTSVYAPKVAARTTAQTGALSAALDPSMTGLVGPDAYKQFMSPYQQEVIDTTLAEFDRNQAIQDTGLRDAAIQQGAFGGARQGVMAAESARGAATNRANLQAQLLAQGFQQAQAAAAQYLAARQGL